MNSYKFVIYVYLEHTKKRRDINRTSCNTAVFRILPLKNYNEYNAHFYINLSIGNFCLNELLHNT